MDTLDRRVRFRTYELLVAGAKHVDPAVLSTSLHERSSEIAASLRRLAAQHLLALNEDGSVRMAHPFSTVDTGYLAIQGGFTWWANCAWDALAILSLLGDGSAMGPNGHLWDVDSGSVSPNGQVLFLVPAAKFWEDIEFTWANIRGFRSDADAKEYAEAARLEGELVSAQVVYDLSLDWYRDRLSFDWEPRTSEAAQHVFAAHGLTGDFWALR